MNEPINSSEDRATRTNLRAALATATPIVTMSRDGLVLVALQWEVDRAPAYETSTIAARNGHVELREVEGGIVATIEAVTTDSPVVIFAGDTLVGGRQNRIINVSVWLKAAAVTPIPVSCLEAGRWDMGSRFEAARKVDYLLRSRVSGQVEEQARLEHAPFDGEGGLPRGQRGTYSADQGAIWSEIAARQARASLHSPTAALHHVYEREADDLASFVAAFPCPARATGLAVGIGGRLVALELFDSASVLAEQWPRLVESAASAYLDRRRAIAAGLEPAPHHRYPDAGAVGRILARAQLALDDAVIGPSVGEGLDIRLSGQKVRGGALVVDGRPVHVELFRAET